MGNGKRRNNEHHCVPKSRGGYMGKVVIIPKNLHDAWHCLFQNLYDEECVKFIEELNRMMNVKNEITMKCLDDLRERIKSFRHFPNKMTKGDLKNGMHFLQKKD